MTLLPTPAVNDMGAGKTVEHWDAWTAAMQAKHGNGNVHGHGPSLSIEALRLLPTPDAAMSQGGHERRGGARGDELLLPGVAKEIQRESVNLLPTPTSMDSHASGGGYNGQTNVTLTDATARQPEKWGRYQAAIQRWESLTRPAPAPTNPDGKGGAHRLSPAFVEWMMGLPEGWVTDTPGITRNEALKALGNGVCPQQAGEAVSWLLGQMQRSAAA